MSRTSTSGARKVGKTATAPTAETTVAPEATPSDSVVASPNTSPGIEWSVRGATGTEYRAVWGKDRVSLFAGDSPVGVVPLRDNAPEAEAEQVAGFYLRRWYAREASGQAARGMGAPRR
jgi:hypothetical protein